MSEIDNLLQELINMKEERLEFNAQKVWEGLAQKKDWSDLGFKTREQFEQFINDNPYSNL